VPGTLNPADDASRGLHPHQLTSEHRWLNGPGFLKQKEDEWQARKEFTPASNDPEIKSHPTRYVDSVTITAETVTIHDRILERRFGNSPRGQWTMCRVLKPIPGKDGVVRQADVKIASGKILRRPVVKLVILETSQNDEEETAH